MPKGWKDEQILPAFFVGRKRGVDVERIRNLLPGHGFLFGFYWPCTSPWSVVVINKESVIAATRAWVEKVVVEMNLCPFARRELLSNRIRFAVSSAESELDLLIELTAELHLLHGDNDVSTTLLIHPAVLQNFGDYNEFLELAEAVLRDSGFEGVYQLASFHPDYQFADTTLNAAANYTNRSPFPMLHLIDEALLESALQNYPDPDQIPQRNITLLESLGQPEMQARLESCYPGVRGKP